ncbi:tumor necrosis factor alpha-induced protein 8-like protein 1 isoform X1 [Pyrgilauda ruficollis]|uniref:tumor necrosis factor alpha-induced protein 8-like protein 1 isoform X1 n=2 Tax=Passeridae TaxID=9158 RepID=UPI001B86A942|nr:tumor necrosis factor alpha-induced protein 8-like protein 1 isoform X1 [Pyrgilauda ruficollis]
MGTRRALGTGTGTSTGSEQGKGEHRCGGAPQHSRRPAAFPVPRSTPGAPPDAAAADPPGLAREGAFPRARCLLSALLPASPRWAHTLPGSVSGCSLPPWQPARAGAWPFLPLLFLGSPGAEMDTFSTKNLALQAQKKLLSKMATKTIANAFIDDTSSEILDELYRATKEYTHNRKEAQKIIKNLIKIVMKLGVLYRNGQFSAEELLLMERFRKKVHTLAMTAVSFHQIDFTFDRRVMSGVLTECRDLLHQAVNGHLTAKSHSRINHVFNHFADYEFLSALYGPAEPYRTHLKRICEGVNKMLEEDSI